MSTGLDILVFGAHPDDAEIGMGGTIAKHTKAGQRVGICDLTFAEMSSNGNVELRQQEAQAASQVLQLAERSILGLPDRGLRSVPEQIDPIVAEIRRLRPRIVFAPYWEDRHPDHIQCGKMVEEAVFNAKLRRYMPEVAPWMVEQFYFYFINDLGPATMMVDVTEVYELKMDSLRAYGSQFEAPKAGNDIVSTPLNQGYLERVEARDRMLGQKRLVGYAEGFVSKPPYLVNLF
ncbi:bacillithiol biosynthesis deacetylase BshB1 [Paenibacillus guangzhouensis]|uniref:bacillithiol biosynthesis deacetylase BshB1 n=1 Tax=Paenibacillus guangzhouensis TaxID=1473112 RepID=UPI001266C003|nr:bacillithiol biosynthesis deacetylase BshB1 [Paenibacillus guangzhouensis]